LLKPYEILAVFAESGAAGSPLLPWRSFHQRVGPAAKQQECILFALSMYRGDRACWITRCHSAAEDAGNRHMKDSTKRERQQKAHFHAILK